MIDLSKVGYNVLEKEGHLEITGGLTITVNLKLSSLIPDEAKPSIIEHAQRRIREKIWEIVYGDLKEPMKHLRDVVCDPVMEGCPEHVADEIQEAVSKVQELLENP